MNRKKKCFLPGSTALVVYSKNTDFFHFQLVRSHIIVEIFVSSHKVLPLEFLKLFPFHPQGNQVLAGSSSLLRMRHTDLHPFKSTHHSCPKTQGVGYVMLPLLESSFRVGSKLLTRQTHLDQKHTIDKALTVIEES